MPDGVHPEAIDAIRAEGADVVQVGGNYDEAVEKAAQLGTQDGHVLVQDTAWVGYEEIPGWIVDGYDTLFVEIDEQLGARGIGRPDLVVVPTGSVRCCRRRSCTTASPGPTRAQRSYRSNPSARRASAPVSRPVDV